ncbi:hypothetical protein EJB05_24860 [Eragrostis curvula]|uniref:Uncharacterized protein n=1 Tax=Eragrostis curvula TaxID=38414 RepID=A0A5J9VAU8_9POAL|nr:hypothetical protein EJB05_24860 [Eragrostis curvula]
MRTQGCLQFEEEADKEHKKMTDKINERTEVVKASYKFVTEQLRCRLASTSRATDFVGGGQCAR